MTRKDPPDDAPISSQPRSYPHGSGDRNAWSPVGDDRMPRRGGGAQRVPDPDPTGPDHTDPAADDGASDR